MAHSPPRTGADIAAEDHAASSAIRRYEERLAKDPDSLVFATLADAYRKAGRTQEAIRLCREGLDRFPEYTTARLALARALADDGDVEAALGELRMILDRNPADVPARRLAGHLEWNRGGFEAAATHLRQAVSLDPSDRESRVLLDVLEAGGQPAGGSALGRLLADDTFATMSFATICLEQGLVDEAAQIFLRLLRRDAGHADARRKLDDALRIKIQKRKG